MWCALFSVEIILLAIVTYLICCSREHKPPWWCNRLVDRHCSRDLSNVTIGLRYTIRALPIADLAGRLVEFIDPILPGFARDCIDHTYLEIETPNGVVSMGVRRTGRVSIYRPNSLLGRCDIQTPDCSLMRASKYLERHPLDIGLRQGIQVARSTTDSLVLVGKQLMCGHICADQLCVIEWFNNHKIVHNQWDTVRLENSQYDFMAPWSTCPMAMSCQMFCILFHRDPVALLSRLMRQ